MNGYIKQKASNEKNQSKKPIAILMILFFAVAFLRPAHSDYTIVYVITAICILTAAVYLIIYKYLVWYSYQLTNNELVFIKNIGSFEKYLMIAPISSIIKIEEKKVADTKNINYPVGDELVGSFDRGGKVYTFSFSPNDEIKKALKELLGSKCIY